MKSSNKLKYCLIGNAALLTASISLFVMFGAKETAYWNFGPNDNLVLINIKIDTWFKYNVLLVVILFFKVFNVVISEIANPILSFNIYNPD